MSQPIRWGLISNNQWLSTEDPALSRTILRAAPRWKVRDVSFPPDYAAGKPELCRWRSRPEGFVMDLGLKSAEVPPTFEQLALDLRQKPPRNARYDKRIEKFNYANDRMLALLDHFVRTSQPVGLLSPANVHLMTFETLDYLRAADLRDKLRAQTLKREALAHSDADLLRRTDMGREVVLPDLGFVCPDVTSSQPDCLRDDGEYAYLWDRPPQQLHCAVQDHKEVIRSVARMQASMLSGQRIENLPPASEELSKKYGACWSVLCRGYSGGYDTVEEYRTALLSAPLGSHAFGKPFVLPDRYAKPSAAASAPWRSRLRKLLAAALLLLIAAAILVAFLQWPHSRIVLSSNAIQPREPLFADLSGSRGTSLAVRWEEHGTWEALADGAKQKMFHRYLTSGPRKVEVQATSPILWLWPVTSTAVAEVDVAPDDLSKAGNLPLTPLSGQYLRVSLDPENGVAPCKLSTTLSMPESMRVAGIVSVGRHTSALAPDETVTFTIQEPGAYLVEWSPNENELNVHGESLRVLIRGGEHGDQAAALPVASFELTPAYALVGEQVHLDTSASTAIAPRQLVKFEVDFGDGGDWQTVTSSGDLKHIFEKVGAYDLRLRVTDDAGEVDECRRTLEVVASLPPRTPVNDRPLVVFSPGTSSPAPDTGNGGAGAANSNNTSSRDGGSTPGGGGAAEQGRQSARPQNRDFRNVIEHPSTPFGNEPLPSPQLVLRTRQTTVGGKSRFVISAVVDGEEGAVELRNTSWKVDGVAHPANMDGDLVLTDVGEFQVTVTAEAGGERLEAAGKVRIRGSVEVVP